MSSTIKPKLGTTAQWQASGRVLEVNEWGVEKTTKGSYILRIGDGEHLFHELPAVFNADTFEAAMAQVETTTEAAHTATENANAARDTALAAAQSALTAANTASIAAQANTNAVVEAVSGDIITVSDSSNLALVGLKLYGKTTQVTTNGYQLFDASKIGAKTAGGCTVTNNGDGSLTISGSGTLTETFALGCDYTHEESVALLQEGTLHLAVGATNPQVVVYLVRNGSTTALDNSSTTAEITQEMLMDTTFFLRLSVYGAPGSAIKTGTIQPMLYQNGDGTYEPYTGGKPSPSPDYPQELVSVGDFGSVCATVCGKNLFDINKITHGFMSNGDLVIGGAVTEFYRTNFKEDTQYTISGYIKNDNRLGDVMLTFMYTDGIFSSVKLRNNTTEYLYKTVTSQAGKTIRYIRVTFNTGGALYIKNGELQIEEGTIATQYEPYKAKSLTTQTPNGLCGIPVASGGNYTDADGQQWIADYKDMDRELNVQSVGRIESYAGEEISGVFLSTTGELSDGATVLYALPTPIETPLSAEEIAAFKALHTNKPNTTVYNDAGAHMAVEYIADTKTYIDNKFTALQNAILSAGANV